MATTPGLRPLGLGEILDVGIKLCVRHWRTLALCVVWLVIPVQVLGVLVLLSAAPDALDPTVDRPLQDEQTNLLVAQGIVYVLQGIVYAISTAACFKAVSDAYLGAEPDARRSLRFGARRLPKLIGLGLLVLACYLGVVGVIAGLAVVAPALAVLIGLALIVPFIWVAMSWSLSAAVLLFEDAGPRKALSRSFELVKGRWFKVAGTLFVGLFLVTLVAGVLQGVLIFVPALAANGNQVVLAFATVVAGTIGSVLTTPFTAAVIALIYFDQRVRKEGFDLELLAAGLGEPAPTGVAPAIALRRPEITPEQRAQAPFWPPPPGWTPPAAHEPAPGWTPPAPPAQDPASGEPAPDAPAPPPAREEPAPDAPARPPGGWRPPVPPSWPPESPERGSGGL